MAFALQFIAAKRAHSELNLAACKDTSKLLAVCKTLESMKRCAELAVSCAR